MTLKQQLKNISQKNMIKRILIKISGEALIGDNNYGIAQEVLSRIAKEIKQIKNKNIEICIVIGGGNIFRGVKGAIEHSMEEAQAHYMGMLATVINALAMQQALENEDIQTRVMSAIDMPKISEPYIRRRAIRHLEKGRIVIFAAGTGNPFFTTDMAGALRAAEMDCDILLKATKVDGIYDKDPKKHNDAKRYDKITYQEVLEKNLKVMDSAAIGLAKQEKIPIIIFDITKPDNLYNVLFSNGKYTIVYEEKI